MATSAHPVNAALNTAGAVPLLNTVMQAAKLLSVDVMAQALHHQLAVEVAVEVVVPTLSRASAVVAPDMAVALSAALNTATAVPVMSTVVLDAKADSVYVIKGMKI